MPTELKVDPKKTANVAKDKLKNNQVTKVAGDVFAKIKAKTGLSQEKGDAWQKSWLAMPKTRKRYEHLQDAPQVVGEEFLAMSNDIIEFVQGKHGGQSHVFKNIKAEFSSMFKDPLGFFKTKLEKGKAAISSVADKAKAGMNKAKQTADKAKSVADQTKAKAGGAKAMAKKMKK